MCIADEWWNAFLYIAPIQKIPKFGDSARACDIGGNFLADLLSLSRAMDPKQGCCSRSTFAKNELSHIHNWMKASSAAGLLLNGRIFVSICCHMNDKTSSHVAIDFYGNPKPCMCLMSR